RGILALAEAGPDLLAEHHRVAARARHRGSAAPERSISRACAGARGVHLSLRGADRRGGDHLEVAAEQPVRPGELRARLAGELVRPRLDHGLADHSERVAVLSLRFT